MQNFTNLLRDFQPAFTALIALIGILTLWNTTRLWGKINRPVIIAFVDINHAGQGITTYDLVVRNIGNLAATEIQLKAKEEDIMICIQQEYKDLIASELPSTFLDGVLKCFSRDLRIVILSSQESTKNAFGSTSGNPQSNMWIYESSFPIKIAYKDLAGKRYETQMQLVIQPRDMFANLQWKEQQAG